jgi:hypothetical protein
VQQRPTSVCLFVGMIELENRGTDVDEIWYGLYAIGAYSKIAHWMGGAPLVGRSIKEPRRWGSTGIQVWC